MAVALSVHAAETPQGSVTKHVRLLAIGNSFSGNATHYLPDLVAASGHRLTFRHISIGGCPLEKHWKNAEAYEQGSTAATARAWSALAAEPWDFVTLQQYSMHSFRIETYRPFARQLHDYIKAKAPTAEILIHETWAYRADDPLFKDGFTQQDMYGQVRQCYETIARELGCRIIPSGDAFENARRDPAWAGIFPDPAFDYRHPKAPALPNQAHSLHKGWSWVAGKGGPPEFKMDGHHANAAGEYLAAAVWYEVLFGDSVEGNSFVPRSIPPADAALLRQIAHRTVAGGLRPTMPAH